MSTSSPLQAAGRNALRLGIFALATALALGLTYALTREDIAAAQREVEARTLIEVIEGIPHDNDVLEDSLPLPEDGRDILHVRDQLIHVVRQNDEAVAFILPSVAPDGYSGSIAMLVGIALDGSLTGVRVTVHGETPGLGDKVELRKSDWIRGFTGLSLRQPAAARWAVRKDGGDFDAFTGATITPRAVVGQISRTLAWFEANRERLVDMSQTPLPNAPEVE